MKSTGLKGKPLKIPVGTGKPRTPEQLAAGQHNFACFQLQGWAGNLRFIRGQVPDAHFQALSKAIDDCLHELKGEHVEIPQPAPGPTLEDWWLVGTPGSYRLSGKVFGHTRLDLPDACHVTTSTLVAYDPESKLASTRTGTAYRLGKPASAFPGDGFKVIAEAKLTFPRLSKGA